MRLCMTCHLWCIKIIYSVCLEVVHRRCDFFSMVLPYCMFTVNTFSIALSFSFSTTVEFLLMTGWVWAEDINNRSPPPVRAEIRGCQLPYWKSHKSVKMRRRERGSTGSNLQQLHLPLGSQHSLSSAARWMHIFAVPDAGLFFNQTE